MNFFSLDIVKWSINSTYAPHFKINSMGTIHEGQHVTISLYLIKNATQSSDLPKLAATQNRG